MSDFLLVPFDLAPQAHNVGLALARCQETFDALMNDYKRITNNIDELKCQCDDAQSTITELRLEIQSLQNAAASASNATLENTSLKNQIAQLKREIVEFERQIQEIQHAGSANGSNAAQIAAEYHAETTELRRSVLQLQQEHANVVAEMRRKHESELLALHSANQATVQMFQQQLALLSKANLKK